MKTDRELIQAFQQGSQQAFDALVRRYLDSTYRFFLRLTKNDMEAEDLTQDVFLKMHKGLQRFRFDADFKTYLFRVNANAANSYLRKKRLRQMVNLESIPEPAGDGENPDLDNAWIQTQLWKSVARLPKQQRIVVIMRIAHELPYKDIAKILNISESSAKVNYHHAVQRLRKELPS